MPRGNANISSHPIFQVPENIRFYLKKMTVLWLFVMIFGLTNASEDGGVQGRDGELTLNGNNNNFLQSALIIVPILLLIIVLDFAIFGTFASRSDELNPISHFFFHTRNGLQSLRAKQRRKYAAQYQQRYKKRHLYYSIIKAYL